MRTLIDLPDEMARSLDEISAHRKTSRAGVIRDAVREYVSRHKPGRLEDAFGLWGKRVGDGLAFQRRIRSEW